MLPKGPPSMFRIFGVDTKTIIQPQGPLLKCFRYSETLLFFNLTE